MRYLTKGREFYVQAGQRIYQTGDPIGSESIYYLMNGSVKLTRVFKDGSEFSHMCGPDETFGVVSAVSGTQREEEAVALEHCQLYVWSKDSFESAVSLYIEFARLAIQHLSRYLRAVNKELARATNP